MTLPQHSRYVVIGAGIHGLSTAWHLAQELEARGEGDGRDIVILDKTGVGAGPSGIACGVIRNNYFQPAMRELMAHSVGVWESDPEAFHYHPIGYLQIAPEVMRADVATIYEQQKAIGYTSRADRGRGRLPNVHGVDLLGLAGEAHHRGPAREEGRLRGEHAVDAGPPRQERGARRRAARAGHGHRVPDRRWRGRRGGDRPGRDRLRRGRGRRRAVGPRPLAHARPPRADLRSSVATGLLYERPMWTYWCLQEGTLGVDPSYLLDNEGNMPPVVHIDTDAPLVDDLDGSIISEDLWGIYYKPDVNFGGVQGGAMPWVVRAAGRRRGGRSVRPPEHRVRRDPRVRADVDVGPRPLPQAVRGEATPLPEGAHRRDRRLHPRQLPRVRPVRGQRVRDRRLEPRLQDDRDRRSSSRRSCWGSRRRSSSRSGSPGSPKGGSTP